MTHIERRRNEAQTDLNPACPTQHGLCRAVLTYAAELHDHAKFLEKCARDGQPALRRGAGRQIQKMMVELTHVVKALDTKVS